MPVSRLAGTIHGDIIVWRVRMYPVLRLIHGLLAKLMIVQRERKSIKWRVLITMVVNLVL